MLRLLLLFVAFLGASIALHNATQYTPFQGGEIWGTLMENNMMYFLGIPSEVSLLQVDPVTLQTVNSASPTIPNLANVNDLYLIEATAFGKIVVAVVWADDSEKSSTTFSVFNIDNLSPVCSGMFPAALGSPISDVGFAADSAVWFLDPLTVFESRNTFYMLDLGSCTISSTNVSLSPSGLAFDQAFVDPTGDGSRLFMMVDEGLWPNSAPYLAVVDADASGSGSLTVSLSVPVQRSSIGIANFYDGSQYWVLSVDQADSLLVYNAELQVVKNVTLNIPGSQLPVFLAPDSQNAFFVVSADRSNGAGQLVQFNTDASLSDYSAFSGASAIYAGSKFVIAVTTSSITRYSVY